MGQVKPPAMGRAQAAAHRYLLGVHASHAIADPAMKHAIPPAEEGLNTAIYAEMRARFVRGRIAPGHELSTRTLAAELGVSQTPVRDALSRLAAEGAVEIRSKRRVLVPRMTRERFDDLLRCRTLLEPAAAVAALPALDAAHIARLREIDDALGQAIAARDADAYMHSNHAFHFTIYGAQPGRTLSQLIETLWLQFGPFMRLVFGHVTELVQTDNHERAIAAIVARDAEALRRAIMSDIDDGMGAIAQMGLASSEALSAA